VFTKHINILGECCKEVLQKMAGIEIAGFEVQLHRSLSATLSVAHSVRYEDLQNKVKGDFILGFSNESAAISVASAIAQSAGLSEVVQLDETALDINHEFLNVLVGNTISKWEKIGLNVRFTPPASFKDQNIDITKTQDTEAYQVKLKFSPGASVTNLKADDLSLMVTFTKVGGANPMGKRILVVDDSAVMRNILAKALRKEGFEVEQAKDGQDAVQKHKEFKPDLTLMDLVMPELGGLDAIMEIRKSSPKAEFIVLTSSSRRDEVVTAKQLNVSSYIIKPVDTKDLMVKVRAAFEQKK
jgi:CheY-like chemotaxis protein/CheY-specific phosphatase CheX